MSEAKAKCLEERVHSTKMLPVKGPQKLLEQKTTGLRVQCAGCVGGREQEICRRKVQGTAWRTGGEDR